ncbi:Cephalosporin hydroxylase [Parvibaculum lavamentivorans DS-1]|uniref:Cephalosporin hydroxylase n=1 Tax=Parvibaculum lavamentivorans (strain DS-1 / DSM 13023 / NCIMB 13966) TaxID=402881 RepID=A7HYG7_PARL1|nr:cephalosporin hydroxylase family protein [Parvibaculum lavamentivorans]ABS64950.1 Cephalosporin hydroxylase [Parvibaculum lavamentivorans DS-1]
MKISIDTESRTIEVGDNEKLDLYSDAAFRVLSDLWVKVGWNQKYSYSFSWLGVPIIQLPEDMIRFQEAIFELKPDVIIETGVAHGGSAIFSASLCHLLGHGRVVAVDIEIRPKNRQRIEAHPFAHLITLIEGSSTAPEIVEQVRSHIKPGDKVVVVLDSDHSYKHVTDELAAYAPMVSEGSWIIATDGVMQDLPDVPRGQPGWDKDNPAAAARDFVAANPGFVLETPAWPFNESTLSDNITHWPDAWVRRAGKA